MLKIGDFSRLSRISIRMLRHYDEMELLKPEKVDNFTGYRYYSAEQLTSAGRISMLKNMGFSLAEIIEINKNYSSAESLQQFLSVKYAEVKEKAEIMNERLDLIKTTIDRLRKDKIMSKYDVNIKEMPQRYVASLRKVIPSYDKEGMLWEQMSKETKRLNMQVDNMCDSLAVFHDEGFKESDVDVEIQISVQGKYENTENVVFKTVEPVLIASAVYKGSYNLLTEVNKAVASWVTDNNYDFNGAMFCIYHVSPAFETNPDNWVTEVCFPVKKR